MKTYVQTGGAIDYTNSGAALSAGDIRVLGNLLCVAITDIPVGATGSMATTGVFELPKVAAAVIGQGQTVLFDSSAGAFDDNLAVAAAGDLSGGCVAFEDAGNTITTVKVAINVGANVRT